MKVLDECGSVREVETISSNRDHVGNYIAEGFLDESQRYDETVSLYERQLSSLRREVSRLRGDIIDLHQQLSKVA